MDGHERPDVIFRRNEFCALFLKELEPRTHRYIQVTVETVEEWRREKKLSADDNRGFAYVSADNKNMVEFHIDDLPLLHEYATAVGLGSFGGNLSIRKPPDIKPLMIFGQDECVYNQFLLGNQQWVAPGGQRALLPKTEGLSLMISGLQSRECTSRDYLRTETVRKLSRRARTYMCAYYSPYHDKTSTALTLPLILRLVKEFKTHRAAIDFDSGFVNSFILKLESGVFIRNCRNEEAAPEE